MSATGSVLLDTNVVVAHFRGDAALVSRLTDAAILCLQWIVLGELHYGAQRASRIEESLNQIRDFLGIAVLLLPDELTSQIYGQVEA